MADDEAPRVVTRTTFETPLAASAQTPTTETAQGPAPPTGSVVPDGRRPRSRRRWLIIAAIAVVFLIVIGYVIGGATAAAGPISRADSALGTTVSHNNTMVEI